MTCFSQRQQCSQCMRPPIVQQPHRLPQRSAQPSAKRCPVEASAAAAAAVPQPDSQPSLLARAAAVVLAIWQAAQARLAAIAKRMDQPLEPEVPPPPSFKPAIIVIPLAACARGLLGALSSDLWLEGRVTGPTRLHSSLGCPSVFAQVLSEQRAKIATRSLPVVTSTAGLCAMHFTARAQLAAARECRASARWVC